MAAEKVFGEIKDNIVETESVQRYSFACQYCTGRDVLEIGCGARNRAKLLSGTAKNVFAVDNSFQALQFSRKKYPAGNVFFVACDAGQLPFKNNSFGAVVCLEVMEHVGKPEFLRGEAKRVLARSGIAVFSTPNKEIVSCSETPLNPHHLKEFSLPEFMHFFSGHFSSAKFFGQSPKKSAVGKTPAMVSFVRREDFLGLRNLFPIPLRIMLGRFFSRFTGAKNSCEINQGDFSISAPSKGSYCFICVCRK